MNDLQKLAVAFGASRIAYAAALLVAPKQAAAPWLGPDAAGGGGKVAARALAIRDGALGTGVAAAAAATQGSMRPWLFACVVSDLVDASATWRERDALPERSGPATLVVAGGMAAAGAALALAAEK